MYAAWKNKNESNERVCFYCTLISDSDCFSKMKEKKKKEQPASNKFTNSFLKKECKLSALRGSDPWSSCTLSIQRDHE